MAPAEPDDGALAAERRLVRRMRWPRSVGLGLGGVAVGGALGQVDAAAPWWGVLALNALVWPQLACAWGDAATPLIDAAKGRLLGAGFRQIDYLELRSGDDLASLERSKEGARLFIAAWLGEVRLIDNLAV